MGWTSGPPQDGQFSVLAQSGFMNRAAQQHLDGVVLVGVDVNTIRAAVDNAVASGVRIVCVVCTSGPQWKGKVVDVTPSWTAAGVLAAWAILAHSGDHTKAAQFYDPEFAAVRLRDAAVTATIKGNCPTCTITTINFPGTDAGKPGPPEWTSYLASHPSGAITDVIGEYDSAALVVSRTDQSQGRAIPVGGYDGEPPNDKDMLTGKPPIAWSIGHPYDYESWIAADVLGRWKATLPIPTGLDQMPIMLVTKANAAELLKGNPPGSGSSYPAPSGDWQGAFKKLWHKA
jgi:ABC-type sugar transport system substrate-binding protein